jgi:RimJ/RimL family protein N-acetyltransferase
VDMPSLTPAVVTAEKFGGSSQPTIPTGDGLVLRPWEPGDAPTVFEAFTDPEIRRWHVRAAASFDEVGAWIDSWVDDWGGRVHAHWAVADSQTAAVVGRASLKGMDLVSGKAGVAYWTVPRARKRGVASHAVEALTAWAFDVVGFHRLELAHSVNNPPSCRVATKTGYLLEGTKRSAGLHLDGWHDMHLHARVKDE